MKIDLQEDQADNKNRIFFEYDKSFLPNPLWLSPYKLPPEPGLFEHKDLNYGPVFGLFDDSRVLMV